MSVLDALFEFVTKWNRDWKDTVQGVCVAKSWAEFGFMV